MSVAKCSIGVLLLCFLGGGALVLEHGTTESQSPVERVLTLLRDLETKIQVEESEETSAYQAYDQWCNETIALKDAAISDATVQVRSLDSDIEKAKGESAGAAAEVKQFKKQIEAIKKSQNEASEVRKKEAVTYVEQRLETQKAIGSLKTAIQAISGSTNGFLSTKTNTLHSIVGDVNSVMSNPITTRLASGDELETVRKFLDRPEDFFDSKSGKMSLLQNGVSPYAPQGDQISGILKAMLDQFEEDLQTSAASETERKTVYNQLMADKNNELASVMASLETSAALTAEKSKAAAEAKVSRDQLMEQQADDQKFLTETKVGCTLKASEYAMRKKSRDDELYGITQTIGVLSSASAQETFGAVSFLQVQSPDAVKREKAYKELKSVASKTQNAALGMIAAKLKTGGVFDDVIKQIDNMIAVLRAEEKEDVEHADRCRASKKSNQHDIDTLTHAISAVGRKITRLETAETDLNAKIARLSSQINATQTSLNEMVSMRQNEKALAATSIAKDQEAVELLKQAQVTLSQSYKSALVQQQPPPPTFSGQRSGYQTEGRSVVAIVEQIIDDLNGDIKKAQTEEAEAEAQYAEQYETAKASLDAQLVAKGAAESELAEVMNKKAGATSEQDQKNEDLAAAREMQSSLVVDCAWVDSHFESRRTKRATEIDGMVQAKAVLEAN